MEVLSLTENVRVMSLPGADMTKLKAHCEWIMSIGDGMAQCYDDGTYDDLIEVCTIYAPAFHSDASQIPLIGGLTDTQRYRHVSHSAATQSHVAVETRIQGVQGRR